MNNLTETERAYLAGLVDGEGCITIQRDKVKTSKSFLCYPVVAISQTNLEFLSSWCSRCGVGRVNAIPVKNRSPKWSQNYLWQIACGDAFDFLESIYPYLSLKPDQALVVLELKKLKGETKNRPASQSVQDERKRLWEKIKSMHQRQRR